MQLCGNQIATGKLDVLRGWWDKLEVLGPSFGYYPNPSKTWLITKEENLNLAIDILSRILIPKLLRREGVI